MPGLLVTGGAGFIGANFVRYWSSGHPGDRLVVLDALTYAGDRANLAGVEPLTFVHGDIRDTALVRRLIRDHGLDTIVHFAAQSHVDRSIAAPGAFVDTNVAGTHSLLVAARAEWLAGGGRPHRFHHVSTDEVYGSLGHDEAPFTEARPYAPNSPYAASKAAADHLVRAYHRTYGLDTVITICSNNYGPYQYPEKLIPLFLRNCLLGLPLPVYGDGMNVRDWLHVEDHVRGIECALRRGLPGEVYHIGGGQELANLVLVQMLCAAVDRAFAADPALSRRFPNAPAVSGTASASLMRMVEDRPGHDRRYALNDGKARAVLGYRARRSLAQGLEETVAWYLRQANFARTAT
ncbi:MAG TPA: dTDP-glucose 4,6-dehydratase [Allosphingosinicella sp.]|jgi:dTDP-glucose 4,6-dehydratase